MSVKVSKENLKLAGELFCKCIEFTTDRDVFSSSLEFASYVQSYSLIIYLNNSNPPAVNEEFSGGYIDDNKSFETWLTEMLETLVNEKEKSDVLNAPENIAATRQKLKDERIARIEKALVELKAEK